MITVHIGGGLGNQLFQYAAARALALRHSTSVRLDLYSFRKETRSLADPLGRPYALDHFALPGAVTAGALYSRLTRHRRRIDNAWLRRLAMPRLFKLELNASYDPAFERLPDGTYLWGFFESHRYFTDAVAQLRVDFAPRDRTMLTRVDAALDNVRRGHPLVSLHVRRGDRVGLDRLIASPRQHQAAMAQFRDVDFLVFSDDLEWCRANIQGPNIFYSPFQSMLDDFWGMTRCDHNIIANSTFSWWAAWLNPNPGRIVVAPEYGGNSANYYPPGWRII